MWKTSEIVYLGQRSQETYINSYRRKAIFLWKCEKKFTQASSLMKHMLFHTGRRPNTCEMCMKQFTSASYLKRHMFIHTGERLFSCEKCEKKFTQASSLKTHMLIHTGEKTYLCEICTKQFVKRSNLKRHMQAHTGIIKQAMQYWEHRPDDIFKDIQIFKNL